MALGKNDNDDHIACTVSIICTSEAEVTRVSEKVGLLLTGLALDGINGNMGFILLEAEKDKE